MPVTPEIGVIWFPSLFLITPVACDLANSLGSLNYSPFGAFTFTYSFRLECFAIYASSLLLPPEMQDSLYSGTGSPCCNGTLTRKMDAAYLGALAKLTIAILAIFVIIFFYFYFNQIRSLVEVNTPYQLPSSIQLDREVK
jgi:hypothetical protein